MLAYPTYMSYTLRVEKIKQTKVGTIMINTNDMSCAEEKKVMDAIVGTTGNVLTSKDFGLNHSSYINDETFAEFRNQFSSYSKNHATFRFVIINVIDDSICIYDNNLNSSLLINIDCGDGALLRGFKQYGVKFTLTPSYADQEFENLTLDALGLTYDKLVAGFLRFHFDHMLFLDAINAEKAKRESGVRDLNLRVKLVRLTDSYYLDIETPIKYSKQLTKEAYDILYHLSYEELVELVRNCFAI